MTLPLQSLLGDVLRITDHSIFFAPPPNDTLDVETVSTAPPSHRSVLQKYGLVAKVIAGVTIDSRAFEKERADLTGVDSPARIIPLHENELPPAECERLWMSALASAGLVSTDVTTLVLPNEYRELRWPLLSEDYYNLLMKDAMRWKASANVNDSPSCVPLLSLERYVYKRRGVRVSLGVMWMPHYPYNLRQWATAMMRAGQKISETALLALLHHMTTGILAVRSSLSIPGSVSATPLSSLTIENVLVYQPPTDDGRGLEERRADAAEEELTFVLSSGACKRECSTSEPDRHHEPSDSGETPGIPMIERALFRTPEEGSPIDRIPPNAPKAKQDTWAMGVILYLLVSGLAVGVRPSALSLLVYGTSSAKKRERRTMLNTAELTPDKLWGALRRIFEGHGYTSTLVHVVAQLLSLDPLTRPSLSTVMAMLLDLNRPTPVRRFPLTLGSYELLRMPRPGEIDLDPDARTYTLANAVTLFADRGGTMSKTAGLTEAPQGISSPSWGGSELLPGLPGTGSECITYLHPLCGAANDQQRRKQVARALQSGHGTDGGREAAHSLDCALLFPLFGGFAVYEPVATTSPNHPAPRRVVVKEVLVPYPAQGLRACDLKMVRTTIDFAGGLPWPSCCTEVLQKSGRVHRNIPFMFTGSRQDVEWFAWILPGERFQLPSGRFWSAPPDGAFVFWFSEDLQPTDRDRYFTLTSIRSATLPTRVSRTVLPDSLFRQYVDDDTHSGRTDTRGRKSSCVRRFSLSQRAFPLAQCSTKPDPDAAQPKVEDEKIEREEADDATSAAARRNSPFSRRKSNTRRRGSTERRSATIKMACVAPLKTLELVESDDTFAPPTMSHRSSLILASHAASAPQQPNKARLGIDLPASQKRKLPANGGCAAAACALVKASKLRSNSGETVPPPDKGFFRNDEVQAPASVHERSPPAFSRRDQPADPKRTRAALGDDISSGEQQKVTQSCNRATSLAVSEALHMLVPQQSDNVMALTPSSAHDTLRTPVELSPFALYSTRDGGVRAPSRLGTPKLPPLMTSLSERLSAIRISGAWLPAETVDATFRALTFWVPSTGEHGYMQLPVKLADRAGSAIRAPPGAAYLSFLSNQAPLFRRNHFGARSLAGSELLIHHGFACYSVNGALLGILALHCRTEGNRELLINEFDLTAHSLAACYPNSVDTRAVYASYLSESAGATASHTLSSAAVETKIRERLRSGQTTRSPLLHVESAPQSPSFNHSLLICTPEREKLTFTSARRLIGELTPYDKGELQPAADPVEVLPAAWMGFDRERVALLFADVQRSVWVPFSLL